jgi:hypothetical protein
MPMPWSATLIWAALAPSRVAETTTRVFSGL